MNSDSNNLLQSNPNKMDETNKLDSGGGFFSWNSPKRPNIFTVMKI